MTNLNNINTKKIIIAGAILIAGTCILTKNTTTSFINVNGTCNQKIEKDLFSLSINIENIAKNSVDAINKSTATYKQIVNNLKKFESIEDKNTDPVMNGITSKKSKKKVIGIETTNYSIRPKEEYNNKTSKYTTVGMRSNIGLKITFSNTETLTTLMDTLKNFNDVRINHFDSFASRAKKQMAILKCIDNALGNAKNKAEKFAYSSNRKVGKILETTIKDSFSYRGPEDLFENMMVKAASLDSDDIFAGSEDTNLNILVKFELK